MMNSLNMLIDLKSLCDMDLDPALGRLRVGIAAELRRGQGAASLAIADCKACGKGELMSVIVGWLLVAAPV